MTHFFDKLPIISYNNMPAKNFLARAKIQEKTVQNRTMYYPYTLSENDRVDILSYKYYDNPDYAWLIWLTNQVIDPYYDVYLNDTDFNNFITSKYGTIEYAQSNIAFYRNNWSIDESEITSAVYNSLDTNIRKYYNALVDQYNVVYAYARKSEDWVVNTNQVVRATIDSIDGDAPAVNEKITQTRISNNEIIATGFVTFSNTSSITLQHITGEFNSNSAAFSCAANSTTFTIDSTEVNYNIPLDEAAFWSPVTYYEYEAEINAAKKNIELIDNRYKLEMSNQLKRLMSV